MPTDRMTIALALAGLLLSLLAFNSYRWHLVEACHREGGIWDGPDSKCRLIPRVIIKRDIERI